MSSRRCRSIAVTLALLGLTGCIEPVVTTPAPSPGEPSSGASSDGSSSDGSDPGSDQGSDPDSDPDTDPGSDPGTDPGTDPASYPDIDPGSASAIRAGSPRSPDRQASVSATSRATSMPRNGDGTRASRPRPRP